MYILYHDRVLTKKKLHIWVHESLLKLYIFPLGLSDVLKIKQTLSFLSVEFEYISYIITEYLSIFLRKKVGPSQAVLNVTLATYKSRTQYHNISYQGIR